MTLVITLNQRNDGIDCAEANGLSVTSRNGATMALVRLLVAAGTPDQPWKTRRPDGKPHRSGPSLHRLARHPQPGKQPQ